MEVVQPEVQAVAVQADEGLVGAKTEPEETQCEELKEASNATSSNLVFPHVL